MKQAAAIAFILTLSVYCSADGLTLRQILGVYEKTDIEAQIDRETATKALKNAELEERDFDTKLSLDSTGVTITKAYDSVTTSAGTVLGLSRSTKTAGTLSSSLSYGIAAKWADPIVMISQFPALSLGWSQPVFATESFLPVDVGQAERREPAIARVRATLAHEDARIGRSLEIADLVVDAVHSRMRLADDTRLLEHRRRKLENLRRRSTLRLAGETELRNEALAIEILANETLALSVDLKSTEAKLAWVLGLDVAPELSSELPVLTPVSHDFVDEIVGLNPALQDREAALEEARIAALVSDLDESATVRTSLSMKFKYDDTNTEERSFPESFNQFWDGEQGGYEIQFSVLVDLPLRRGASRAARHDAEGAAQRIALLRRDAAVVELERTADSLLARMHDRRRSAELADERLSLTMREAEIAQKLLPLGQATEEEVTGALIKVDRDVTALWRARADLFLSGLELRALGGVSPLEALE